MNLSLLVHTFNDYRHLWAGSARAINQFFPVEIPIYWGTDITTVDRETKWAGKMIFSGTGEWSDRLRALLKEIPTEYVLYMQEDHWPTQKPPDLVVLMQKMTENDLFRLQISPVVHFYTLKNHENTLFFEPKSKYLVSHQPSIWKKSFLLDCLKPGETPWVNEYEGTKRLQQTSLMREYITNKIAIYPCDWFSHRCIKGRVVTDKPIEADN